MKKMKAYASFDDYLADQSMKNQEIIRALRRFVRRVQPTLIESVKWGNGCWLGNDGPVAYVYSDDEYVQFGFFRGATLKDPKGLLEGKGSYVRHIKVRKRSDIDAQAFALLLGQAAGPQRTRRAAPSKKQPKETNKTKPTGASVENHIASKANAEQRSDCLELITLMKKVTRQPAKMWGPSIVGFGSYRYTYESGRTGEAALTGFAIRGRDLVVYLMADTEKQRSLLAKLGQHKMTMSCLYFKRLADLDRSVLERLIAGSIADVRKRFG